MQCKIRTTGVQREVTESWSSMNKIQKRDMLIHFRGGDEPMRRHRDRMNMVQVWVKQAHQRRGHSPQRGKQGCLAETRKVSWGTYPEECGLAEDLGGHSRLL